MASPRRYIVIASSILLLLVVAVSLATSITVRAPPNKLVQISLAQAFKVQKSDVETNRKGVAGGKIKGTDFDRADVVNGTSTVGPQQHGSTLYISGVKTVTMSPDEGMIGQTPTPRPTQSQDDGFIGDKSTSTPIPIPTPRPPQPAKQMPILVFSYTRSGGPKHCRGELVQKLRIPPPASAWKNGTCVDLHAEAQCGVFVAGKDDNCEAQLFNMPGCLNTTMTYVNTVVFMPEERTVGALWTSMFIRCGVDAPDAGLLDPAILKGLLKPKPGGG
jgi:hypothetical protein